jgi:iron only hydrogenase large subunit-like protein
MKCVTIIINNQKYDVPENITVLNAAERLGIHIPRLCFLRDINETSACRLCIVDIKNTKGLKQSCTTRVFDGMEIVTNSEVIKNNIIMNLKLLASNHVFECWACEREDSCEFLALLRRYNVENEFGESNDYKHKERKVTLNSPAITLDSGKCVLCNRCISACQKLTNLNVLTMYERANNTFVGPYIFHSLEASGCISCGKCIEVCPTAAIKETSSVDEVLDALRNPYKKVVAVAHPLVGITLGEEFGYEIGSDVTKAFRHSISALGFDDFIDFDMAYLAKLKQLAQEIEKHFEKKQMLLISEVSGFVPFFEMHASRYLDNLSKVKNTEQIAGYLVKHQFVDLLNCYPEDIVTVSITPKLDLKLARQRVDNQHLGINDLDYVLTTREYARLLKRKGIHLNNNSGIVYSNFPSEKQPVYNYSGLLINALSMLSDKNRETFSINSFKLVKGYHNILEAVFSLAGKDYTVAITTGELTLTQFVSFLDNTKKHFDLIEFNGGFGQLVAGGNPIQPAIILDSKLHQIKRKEATIRLLNGKPSYPFDMEILKNATFMQLETKQK